MSIDLGIVALIGLFAVFGYFSGAVRQLSHWIGLAAALLGAKPAAAYLGPAIAARAGWSPAATTTGLTAALLPVLFIVAAVLSRIVLNLLEPGDERGPLDQGLGVVVGAAKGAVILFAALCLAVSFEKPLAQMHFDVQAKTRGSWLAGFAREHNLFADGRLPGLDGLRKILESDPRARKALLKDRDFQGLGKALNDPSLLEAVRNGDSTILLNNPAIRKILEDPKLVEKLERL